MSALTYILADDEQIYRTCVQQYLSLDQEVECLQACEDAFQVAEALQKHEPDVLILDVEMPGLNGIQFVKTLKKQPHIIFITSHSKYAMDAFDADAVDFVKKPIPPERLLRAMNKVKELIRIRKAAEGEEVFRKNDQDSFFVRQDYSLIRINYEDVLYMESLNDFTKIHLVQGEEKLVLVSLKNMEIQLPEQRFVRISRTYLVNKQHITALNKNEIHLNKVVLAVGVTYADKIQESIIGSKEIKRHL